jgi:hypothetical protein
MKTVFEEIVDEVVTYNVKAARADGNTRIYTPAVYVSDVFRDAHRHDDMFNTLLGILSVQELTAAEQLVEDALAHGDERDAEFYADCMRLGEQLVLAIQNSIEMKLRNRVKAKLEGKR